MTETDTELLSFFKALADAKADGTYKKLYEQWIGPYDESAANAAGAASASPSAAS